jgi:hypothetical protein
MISRRATPLRSFQLLARFALSSTVLLVACGAPPSDGSDVPGGDDDSDPIGRTSEAIIGGVTSDASQNAVVLLIHSFPGGFEACSGTMLAPQLVLTARHCLAKTSTSVQCSASGQTVQGSVQLDFDPTTVLVFGGMNRPETQAAVNQASRGAKIFDDGAATLCNHDISLLLVDKPVIGANIAPIRLDTLAGVGEALTLVGWGETESTPLPSVRQQRTGVKVIASGTHDGVGSSEFVLGEGSCEGDSGGPAFSAAGAVVGASSRGGNNTDSTGAAGCVGAINIYTAPLGFKSIILAAYQAAGQEPWLEGQPNPTLAKAGDTCTANQDCQSNSCSPMTHTCDTTAPTTTTIRKSGCSISGSISGGPGPEDPSALVGITALAGVLAITRRRRDRRRSSVTPCAAANGAKY